MNENPVLKIDSPDRRHRAILTCAGEVRHGPWYFSLAVDEMLFSARVFGDDHLWSDDSRYFVIQEWHSTDYSRGPVTGLLLVDLNTGDLHSLVPKTAGFVRPVRFAEDELIWSMSGDERTKRVKFALSQSISSNRDPIDKFKKLTVSESMQQTISNGTNDISSLGAPISEHRRMKKSSFVFTVVPYICFALGIFFVGAGVYSIGSLKEVLSALILALIFFACGLPLWIVARRERDLSLRTYAGGFIYRRNNQETVAGWNDVAEVYEAAENRSVNGIPVGTFYKYTIELKDGTRIKTSERLAEMEMLSRTIRSQLFPRLFVEAVEHYNSGAEVKFGEISVNENGIAYRQKLLPWNEFSETQLINGHLKIIGADGKKAWATVALAKIPNYSVLTALLDDIFKGQERYAFRKK